MTTLLQVLLCGLVIAAPWLCGAVTPKPQFYLAIALAVISLLRFIQRLFKLDGPRSAGIPTVMIPAAGLLILGVWQLSPSGNVSPLSEAQSATYSNLVPELITTGEMSGFAKGLHTLSPHATQLTLAQLMLALLAFWLSFDLFEDHSGRRMLNWALALNGVAMAGFGVAQQMSWNGKLFWFIPLRYGGSPFGAFVNRNNGAGYLLLALACALACLVSAWFPFGVGQRSNYRDHSRSQFSEWVTRILGHVTPAVMFSFFTVAAIAMGIMASLSRAGAVGMVAALLILVPAVNRWKTRILVILVVFVGLAYGGLMWLGQNERITKRMETLKDLSTALTGRFEHWRDVVPLVKDFPKTGTGWGTYAMANQLYVSRNSNLWYRHAENHYLEILTEGGAIGLGLFLMVLLMIAYASARAIRSDIDGRTMPSGMAGLLAVTSMGTISLTDFSLSIGSIVLTFCVISGAAIAPFSRTRPVSLAILFANRWPIWRILSGAVLLLAAVPALAQLHIASQIETVRDAIPIDEGEPPLDVSQCDELLSQLAALRERYPDQPDLIAATGELYITRYRRMMYDDLINQPVAKSMKPRGLWASSHLERLDEAVILLRLKGDFEKATQLLASREVQENLPQALAECRHSLRLKPLQPGLSMQCAWLTHILSDPAAPYARNMAMFVGASDSDSLFQLGHLSAHRGDMDECINCWKRSLNISGRWAKAIWDQSTLYRDEMETLALFPDRLDSLLEIAKLPSDLVVRQQIRSKIQRLTESDSTITNAILARVYVELEDNQRAADFYLAALREDPLNIALRIDASEVLEREERLDEAREVIGVALRMYPQRADLKRRFEALIEKERSLSTPRQFDRTRNTAPNNR